MPDIFSVGVDLGGTWLRLEAIDHRGRSLKSLKRSSVPVAALAPFLKKHLPRWVKHSPHLIVASRGIWTTAERTRLKKQLRGLASRIDVISDVEAAWHAAFSLPSPRPSPSGRGIKGEGIVLIAGTGSIAYGRDLRGRARRAGGLGPKLGDEGSAFWIGKTWMHRTRKKCPPALTHASVRQIASQTRRVLRLANAGNSVAKAVIHEAHGHLADLIDQVTQALNLKAPVPVSWGGGLMNQPGFRAGVFRALQRPGHPRVKRITPDSNAALAIARLAL